MTTRRPPITVHIERLVLDGLPLTGAQMARMQRALERELASIIAQGGDLPAWAGGGAVHAAPAAPAAPATPATAAPAVPWDATRPHQLGCALAHSVFASLNGQPPRGAGPRGRS
ncbi:MAG TPA: hypothetical protein VNO30_46310 [Kofleriaceae bacterium]|nr:hypothetical protein [Kofleriaceae bacterium]